MLGLRNRQRGDTLIEVMFAITVFSFVVVGGWCGHGNVIFV